MGKKVECYSCADDLTGVESDQFDFEGDVYCEECYNDTFSTCAGCRTVYHSEEMVCVLAAGEMYCQRCFENDFSICTGCQEIVNNQDACICDGCGTMCRDCHGESHYICTNCDE